MIVEFSVLLAERTHSSSHEAKNQSMALLVVKSVLAVLARYLPECCHPQPIKYLPEYTIKYVALIISIC